MRGLIVKDRVMKEFYTHDANNTGSNGITVADLLKGIGRDAHYLKIKSISFQFEKAQEVGAMNGGVEVIVLERKYQIFTYNNTGPDAVWTPTKGSFYDGFVPIDYFPGEVVFLGNGNMYVTITYEVI